MPLIYIVEDDEDIRELSVYALRSGGFDCEGYESAADFLEALERKRPDLALLDIMLPGEDGLSLLKRLRGNKRYAQLPVIMLTAKGSEADKVRGLNLGADDYVSKPFGVTELTARIHAVLRRAGGTPMEAEELSFRDLELSGQRHEVRVAGEGVQLTFREFELLRYLLINRDIVLSRNKLMDEVWGYDYAGESRTVDMHIKSLRQKLGGAGDYIKTVRNVGYKIGD